MEILKHRANSLDDLSSEMGLEIDVRDFNNELVLSHDHPNTNSLKLEDFLKNISETQLLAINIKSSEIENELSSLLDKSNISNYFTFDWPVPSLLKALKQNIICAFRLSEFSRTLKLFFRQDRSPRGQIAGSLEPCPKIVGRIF